MVSFTGVVPGIGAATSSTNPIYVLTDVHDSVAAAWASKVFRYQCVTNPVSAPRSRTVDVADGDLAFAARREERDVRALFIYSTRKSKLSKNSDLHIDVFDYELLADIASQNCQPGCRLYLNFLCDVDALQKTKDRISEACSFAGFVNEQW